MCENLKGRFGRSSVDGARLTELSADVVGAGCCRVTRQGGLSEIPALLGHILDEGGSIGIGLRNGEIEDTSAGRDCDWDGHVDACFGSCRASKHGDREGEFGEHVWFVRPWRFTGQSVLFHRIEGIGIAWTVERKWRG